MENEKTYPIVEGEEGRLQVRRSENNYLLGVKHLGHWCGYKLVSPELREKLTDDIMREIRSGVTEQVTYFGPSTLQITWAARTKKEMKLSVPTLITEDDFWIGFDLHREPEVQSMDFSRRLAIFDTEIRTILGLRGIET